MVSCENALSVMIISNISHYCLQEKSYYALAAFCENMGEEIVAYLDPLMRQLMAALGNSPRNLQETCMVHYQYFLEFL